VARWGGKCECDHATCSGGGNSVGAARKSETRCGRGRPGHECPTEESASRKYLWPGHGAGGSTTDAAPTAAPPSASHSPCTSAALAAGSAWSLLSPQSANPAPV